MKPGVSLFPCRRLPSSTAVVFPTSRVPTVCCHFKVNLYSHLVVSRSKSYAIAAPFMPAKDARAGKQHDIGISYSSDRPLNRFHLAAKKLPVLNGRGS